MSDIDITDVFIKHLKDLNTYSIPNDDDFDAYSFIDFLTHFINNNQTRIIYYINKDNEKIEEIKLLILNFLKYLQYYIIELTKDTNPWLIDESDLINNAFKLLYIIFTPLSTNLKVEFDSISNNDLKSLNEHVKDIKDSYDVD